MVDDLNRRAHEARRVDYELLRRLAEEAFEIACQPGSDGEQYEYGMASALSLLANRSCTIGEWSTAISQCSQALALIANMPPDSLLAEIYDSIGWAHYYMGDYVEALHHLMKSLRVSEVVGDRSLQAHALDRIGSVNSSAGHSLEALESQDRALEIHRDLDDPLGEAIVLNNVAYTLLDIGDSETALGCAKLALDYCNRVDMPYLTVGVLDTLADIYLSLGDLDEASGLSESALVMAREHRLEPDEANILRSLGEIASLRGEHEQGIELVQQALAIAERRSQHVEEFECQRLLSEIHERAGDAASALAHFKQYHEIQKSKLNGETESRLASLRVEHQVQTARKDAEILRLRSLALEREVERQKIAQVELEAQASLDPLTGLFNRRHLTVLAEELSIATRMGRPVSLMMFDIDHFKQINDSLGHGTGDRVLIAIAQQITANARRSDVPCRYGGDEFLVLLIDMDTQGAGDAAERLREAVSSSPIEADSGAIRVTISAGVASAEPGGQTTLDDLIERADKALYAAKQAGRDRVIVYGRDI